MQGFGKRAAQLKLLQSEGNLQAIAHLGTALRTSLTYALETNNDAVANEIRLHLEALSGKEDFIYDLTAFANLDQAFAEPMIASQINRGVSRS